MLLRLIIKDWWLIALFLLSLVVMLICKMDISFDISFQWQAFIRDSMFCIAGGYIAGYIFYIFSVLRPKSTRMVPVLKLAGHQIRYARDTINEMSSEICGTLEFEKGKFKIMVAEKRSYDNYEMDYSNCRVLLQGLQNVHLLIQYPISAVEYYDSEDICELSKIIRLVSKNIAMLKDFEPSKVINIGEDNLNTIVDDISKCYMILDKIYNRIKRRIGYEEREDIV